MIRDEFEEPWAGDERFREIVETSHDLLYTTDAGLTITYVNEAVREVLGYAPEELIGRRADEVFPAGDIGRARAAALERGNLRDWHLELRSRSGDLVHVAVHTVVRRDADGTVLGTAGTVRDITAAVLSRQELERSLERLRAAEAARRRLLVELVSAQEDERAAVAADVHDEVVPTVGALILRLAALRDGLPAGSALEAVDEVSRSLHEVTQRLRQLMFELSPIESSGLAAALATFLDQAQAPGGPELVLVDELREEPDLVQRKVLYRVAVEAVRNACRHAGAARVEVRLASTPGSLRLTVSDDGRGMPGEPPARPGHIGVASMRRRVHALGGRLEIEPGPGGGGTRVVADVPSSLDEPAP